MKYIKYFEASNYEFDIIEDRPSGYVQYIADVDGHIYEIEFIHHEWCMPEGIYYREFSLKGDHEIPKNAFSVGNCIADVTKDFIKNKHPNGIVIPHVSEKNEKIGKILNQRAKLGYRYLKNIPGYRISYYRTIMDLETVYCYICRDNYDTPLYKIKGIKHNELIRIYP